MLHAADGKAVARHTAIGHSCGMPGLALLRTFNVKANRAAVTVGRRLAIDRHTQSEDRTLVKIKATAFGIYDAFLTTQSAKHGIVEFF